MINGKLPGMLFGFGFMGSTLILIVYLLISKFLFQSKYWNFGTARNNPADSLMLNRSLNEKRSEVHASLVKDFKTFHETS